MIQYYATLAAASTKHAKSTHPRAQLKKTTWDKTVSSFYIYWSEVFKHISTFS